MSVAIARARRAMRRIHERNAEAQWTYATVGRLVAGVPTFDVTGRANYMLVTIRQANGSQTSVPARNDAGVPRALGLPVRMYKQGTTFVIDSIAKRSDLAYTSPGQDPAIHTHDSRYFTETEFTGAADLGAPVDTDKLIAARSGGIGSLLWSALKTALNALYVTLTGAQSIAGAKEFTDDLTRRETGGVAFMKVISDGSQAVHQVISYRASATGGFMGGYSARGSEGTPAVSQNGDRVFSFTAFGWSAAANDWQPVGQFNFNVDGTPDSGGDTTDMPGRIVFLTTPDGSATPTQVLTLDSAQLATFAKYLVWAGQKRVGTQFDKTNTTLATITGLSVSVEAGIAYYFEATLHITADATGGHKVAIAGTATATSIIYQVESLDNGTDALVIASRQTSLGGSVGQAGATEVRCTIRGQIVVNAAGTLLVQFAQNASSGTSSVLVGSTFVVNQVA